MTSPVWILKGVILSLVDQLAAYGEKYQIRDPELLEDILFQIPNLFYKDQKSDFFELAGSYGAEIINKQPFIHGNIGICFVIVILFLSLHGYNICASRSEKAIVFLLFGNNLLSEKQLTLWLRAKSRKISLKRT